ncbi:Eukaryotic rRNA processing protein EBP2 domain containing protein [Lactarius tabidus]
MPGQKTKTASKKSALKPSKGKSIKGSTKGILTQSAEPIEAALSNHESESGTSGTEDDDDNEEGLEKLMKALGEEGHSEFDLAQLRTLAGTAASDEEAGEEDDGRSDEMDEEEDEDEIALDDEDVDLVDEDAVPTRKVAIDNKIALERIRDTIKLDPSLPWTETLAVSFPETIDVDVDDDLNRELAFYKQALHGAKAARSLATKHGLPFTRPDDFFAEMVKTDAHMERIRQRLLDETAGIAKSEARRREREGKKIGKQVQLEKIKERERSKKDTEERLKVLKRKRKGALDNAQVDDDAFDIAVEDAIADRPAKRGRGGGRGGGLPRHARDKKFGFGGHGKREKQNTRSSTDDLDGSSWRGGGRGRGRGQGRGRGRGGKSQRPGKARRAEGRNRS